MNTNRIISLAFVVAVISCRPVQAATLYVLDNSSNATLEWIGTATSSVTVVGATG
jgi:hypothetical protein